MIHIGARFAVVYPCLKPHKKKKLFRKMSSSSSRSRTNSCNRPQRAPAIKSMIAVMTWVLLPMFSPQLTESQRRLINCVCYRAELLDWICFAYNAAPKLIEAHLINGLFWSHFSVKLGTVQVPHKLKPPKCTSVKQIQWKQRIIIVMEEVLQGCCITLHAFHLGVPNTLCSLCTKMLIDHILLRNTALFPTAEDSIICWCLGFAVITVSSFLSSRSEAVDLSPWRAAVSCSCLISKPKVKSV